MSKKNKVLLFAGEESQSQQYLVRSASKWQSVAVIGRAKLPDSWPKQPFNISLVQGKFRKQLVINSVRKLLRQNIPENNTARLILQVRNFGKILATKEDG